MRKIKIWNKNIFVEKLFLANEYFKFSNFPIISNSEHTNKKMVLEKFAPVGMEKSTNRTTIKSKLNSSAQVVNNGQITTIPNSFKTSTLRRIKRLFLIYLKQFDIEEFKLMIKFLRFILNKYKLEPLKLFGI
jgi:hypothetical protein